MEYIPSKIENEFMDKITKELKKYENLSDLEKAYYVYYRFCQFYVRNDAFYYGYDSKAINEQYTKQTEEDRKATCYQENACIAICLNRIGINAGFLKTEIQHHVDGYFCLKSGQIYFYDAASDLVRAKTGRILRKFGIDLKTLRSTRSREYIEYIRNKFAEDGINIDENKAEYLTEDEIKNIDKNLNFKTLGIFTNDFYKTLEELLNNEEYMRTKFSTRDKGKQLEQLVDIINTHKVPNDTEFNTDYSTGSAIYMKIFSMFPSNFCEIFDGYEKKQNAGKERKFFIIKKEDGIVIYEFDEEISKLKKVNPKELEDKPIYNSRRYKGFRRLTDEERKIGYFIKEVDKSRISMEH